MPENTRGRAKGRLPEHDHSYRRLFSHPQAIEELLRGFVTENWVRDLDFSTLERIDPGFISDDLRGRNSDVIWKMGWRDGRKGGSLYLYLLLEFQSTSYHFMAVRLLTYVGLLLEQIIRTEELKPGDKLPIVLPMVLHNGERPWRAPLELQTLFSPAPQGLTRRLPRLAYLLVDENRLDLNQSRLEDNWMAALFRIETCRVPENLPPLTEKLASLLPGRSEPELRRTFNVWLGSVLRRTFPGATIPSVDLEDSPMLEQTLIEWRERLQREGLVAGMRRMLLQQMEVRFGPLPDSIQRQVEAITSARELERLAKRVLVVDSLADMKIGQPARKKPKKKPA